MKNKLKGMTLVELVVAIAILGLGSTMLVTSFAAVSMVNRETHQFNERMCQQVKIAENASDDTSNPNLKHVDNVIEIEVDTTKSQPDCFDKTKWPATLMSGDIKGKLAGDSFWVDIDAPKSDTMVDESIDFKYYNVFLPPEQPPVTTAPPGP